LDIGSNEQKEHYQRWAISGQAATNQTQPTHFVIVFISSKNFLSHITDLGELPIQTFFPHGDLVVAT
jgi:hypothetical protein